MAKILSAALVTRIGCYGKGNAQPRFFLVSLYIIVPYRQCIRRRYGEQVKMGNVALIYLVNPDRRQACQ